jgi:transposase
VADLASTTLESLEVGALPIINSFLQRLRLREILERHLPPPSTRPGRTPEVSSVTVLLVLVRNILLSRQPMYAISQWLGDFVPELFDLNPLQVRFFNDDRIGRALERLFDGCSQAAVVTDLALQAISAFSIQLDQFHQDSTTVTFHGDYSDSRPNDAVPHITFGYNKDHRPDLKQLLWSLVVSADGAVPVHFSLHPGNTADDQLHQQTWLTLRQLAGTSHFCYVGDCKLASSDNMRFIADQHGTFLSVLPRTRKEIEDFGELASQQPIHWREVRRDPDRSAQGRDAVYHGWECPRRSREGFRVLWYRSSQKLRLDQEQRSTRLASARQDLRHLERRSPSNTSVPEIQQAVDAILKRHQSEGLLRVTVERRVKQEFKQQGPGRPGPNTQYESVDAPYFVVEVADDGPALQAAARWDGLFPLITNSETFTLEEALDKYKYQPFLEKRHQQLKSVLEVAPVFLKSPKRVASMMMLYYIALLIYALIERELRQRMQEEGVEAMALYPEGRATTRPTADLAMGTFSRLRRHRLLDASGTLLKTFHDALPPEAAMILQLLNVDSTPYQT